MSKDKKNNSVKINPAMFDLIMSPIVTEKSTAALENNKVVIKVRSDANKATIKSAVESVFDVKVASVNVMNVKGKVKRFRGVVGKRSDFKKAIVTLAEGSYIDFTVRA